MPVLTVVQQRALEALRMGSRRLELIRLDERNPFLFLVESGHASLEGADSDSAPYLRITPKGERYLKTLHVTVPSRILFTNREEA